MLPGYLPPPCTAHCPHTGSGDLRAYLIVVGSVAAAVILGYCVKVEAEHRLRTRGLAATAVITALDGRRVIQNSPDIKVDVTLRVTTPEGEEFETWTTARLPIVGLPQVGWEVQVRYSRRDRYRIALVGEAAPPHMGPPSHPMER